jgi:hypothetical protein
LGGLGQKTTDFFTSDTWKTDNVDEVFASYPMSLRNAIKDAQ